MGGSGLAKNWCPVTGHRLETRMVPNDFNDFADFGGQELSNGHFGIKNEN